MSGPVHQRALQAGCMLHWYHVQRTLGQGSFGITYLARDINLEQLVAVKEYLPVDFAARGGDRSVHATSEDQEQQFRWGLERFIVEAQTLARFDHPNIVRVHVVFKANNTAYMVMRYEQGATLHSILRTRSRLEESELRRILIPILDGLERIHESGYIHRDIKPGNILIRRDKSPVLIDFGSAREALGQRADTLTTLVSPGYAPFEQYSAKSEEQGPWSDIYSLAATLYRCVTGSAPVEAIERSSSVLQNVPDPLLPAGEIAVGRYSRRFLAALDRGLSLRVNDRPPSIEAWREDFGLTEDLSDVDRNLTLAVPTATMTPPTLPVAPDRTQKHGTQVARTRRLYRLEWQPNVVGAVAVLLVVVFGLAWRYQSGVAESAGLRAVGEGSSRGVRVAQKELVPAPKGTVEGRGTHAAESAGSPRTRSEGREAASPRSNSGAKSRQGAKPARAQVAAATQAESKPSGQADTRAPAEKSPAGAPESAQSRIDGLLARADEALAGDRLTTPVNDSAYRYYRQVLELEPDNKRAAEGLSRIVERYAVLAKVQVDEADYVEARRFVKRGLRIEPRHPRLLALRRQIQQRNKARAEVAAQAGSPTQAVEGASASDPPAAQAQEDKSSVGETVHNIGNALKTLFKPSSEGSPPNLQRR